MYNQNIIQYFKTGDVGNCPKCNKPLKIVKTETPIRDNFYIECTKCGNNEYFVGNTKQV